MGPVVVVGSANVDVVLRVDRIPAPGETVTAGSRLLGPGGKGANQAMAAARCGAATSFLGSVGADRGGDLLRSSMAAAGVDLAGFRVVDEDTGAAYVVVDARGENTVVVNPGANAAVADLSERDRMQLASAAVVLCQLEIPVSRVAEALAAGRAAGALTVLNAAPAMALPDDITGMLDVLIVNEHEARVLSGCDSADDAVPVLLERVPEVIVTLGAQGLLVATPKGSLRLAATPARSVVDTTGAGDVFCGAYAAGRLAGLDGVAAATRAAVAASLSVEREGAGSAAPTLAEVLAREGES